MLNSNNIVIDFDDLQQGKDLSTVIEEAFGPKGHGILFVKNIPEFTEQRIQTLPLIWKLANLPPQTLNKYKRPQIFHSLGWSCGVQKFHGKCDVSKGSYYINCSSDQPQPISPENMHLYTPDQIKTNVGNKWVQEIPQIEVNVKKLAKIMINTGILLAKQIDACVSKNVPNYPPKNLENIISKGTGHIGRMLNYFPFQEKGQTQDDWCGWHNDHGSLTALTSAIYVDAEGKEIDIKSTDGGLFAKNRFAQVTRIAIPKDMLAFQLGESSQIHTGGFLEATPHCVIRSNEIAGKKISRNTFALFMEPDHLVKMSVPQGTTQQKLSGNVAYKIPQLKDRWKNGMYFKDFHLSTIKHYS